MTVLIVITIIFCCAPDSDDWSVTLSLAICRPAEQKPTAIIHRWQLALLFALIPFPSPATRRGRWMHSNEDGERSSRQATRQEAPTPGLRRPTAHNCSAAVLIKTRAKVSRDNDFLMTACHAYRRSIHCFSGCCSEKFYFFFFSTEFDLCLFRETDNFTVFVVLLQFLLLCCKNKSANTGRRWERCSLYGATYINSY